MANTLKSFGQNVEQEPTDELLGGECHGLVTAVALMAAAVTLLSGRRAQRSDTPQWRS